MNGSNGMNEICANTITTLPWINSLEYNGRRYFFFFCYCSFFFSQRIGGQRFNRCVDKVPTYECTGIFFGGPRSVGSVEGETYCSEGPCTFRVAGPRGGSVEQTRMKKQNIGKQTIAIAGRQWRLTN